MQLLLQDPRLKLMRSTQRFFNRNLNENNKLKGGLNHVTNHMPAENNGGFITSNNIEMVHPHSNQLWNPSPVMTNGMLPVRHTKGIVHIAPPSNIDFQMQPPQMMVGLSSAYCHKFAFSYIVSDKNSPRFRRHCSSDIKMIL